MIYFDNASTTKPFKDVLDLYCELSKTSFYNPHSLHKGAVLNKSEIERIRKNFVKLFNLKDYDVIFTSGATEANNLCIRGFLKRNPRYKHLLTSKIEHSSVLNVFKELEKEGYKVDYIKANKDGQIDLDDLEKHLDGTPTFASFMCINNETGSFSNLKEIRRKLGNNVVFHSDLVQTIGKTKIDVSDLDLFVFTSHKINGIKNIGCLFKKKNINIDQLVYGGDQEFGIRPGTIDYAAISAFYLAVKNTLSNYENEYKKVKEIHDYIVGELSKNDEIILHNFKDSTPFILNFSLKTKKASVVIEALSNNEIYVNGVSACYSKGEVTSYVLEECGCSLVEAQNPIRLSFGIENTLEEAKIFVKNLNEILLSLRGR